MPQRTWRRGSSTIRPVPVALTIEKEEHVFLKATSRMVSRDQGVVLDSVSIKLPQGMPGGTYTIFADTRELPIMGQPPRRAVVGHLTARASPGGKPIRARVEQRNGAPAIVLDGRPSNGLMYMTYALEEEPAYVSGLKAMRDLTGMRIVAGDQRRPVNVAVPGDGTLVDEKVTYGTSSPVGPASFGEGKISPTFHVEDDTVEVLGLDAATNRDALCVKEMNGWMSIYSAAPCVAPSVLRALAKRAGVHVYVNEDIVVYANNSLLSVSVDDPGRRTVRSRRPSTIEDGFTGETLGRDIRELDVEFGERQSRLFLLTH